MNKNVLSEIELPELVGSLAALPEQMKNVIRAYGHACAATALQSPEIQQLRKDRDALIDELKSLIHGYLNCLENGRDRIVFFGGDCDSMEVMEASDTYLRSARELLSAMEVKP